MTRVVVFDEFGGPEVLRVVDARVPEPAAGEVRLRIEAFAVNPLDAMMRAGSSPLPIPLPGARLGVEGTGVVDEVGSGVDGLAAGDPVIVTAVPDATARGTYADTITIAADRVIRRPDGLAVAEAAAIWVAFSTAYGALVEKAGMRPGDHVLITAATGAVGRTAIQIARHLGAVPIALTRSAARREELLEVGAAAVVAHDEQDIADAVRTQTGGAGADIVLDLVTGPGQQELANAARPGATLVAAGILDPRPAPQPAGASLRIFTGYRSFEHTLAPAAIGRMAALLKASVRAGSVHPAVDDDVLTLDDVAEAHRRLEAGHHGGRKIVVRT
jgi:NADPH:quinone reductase-like Zn-dependent oxidoreductase